MPGLFNSRTVAEGECEIVAVGFRNFSLRLGFKSIRFVDMTALGKLLCIRWLGNFVEV